MINRIITFLYFTPCLSDFQPSSQFLVSLTPSETVVHPGVTVASHPVVEPLAAVTPHTVVQPEVTVVPHPVVQPEAIQSAYQSEHQASNTTGM